MLGWTFYKRKGHKPDEQLNGLIEQSRRTVDPEQRKRMLQQFGRYVHEQAYWLFIHAQDEFYARRRGGPLGTLPPTARASRTCASTVRQGASWGSRPALLARRTPPPLVLRFLGRYRAVQANGLVHLSHSRLTRHAAAEEGLTHP